MAMTINTNMQSLNAQRNLSTTQGLLSTTMQRLSSGLRVNSAKDDAAGLAIAERMNAQVKGMNVAARNANDGISLAQTAEGALGKITENLQRMRELGVQAANGTNGTKDRTALDKEYKALAAEIGRITDNTEFNGKKLLNANANFTFQVGANTAADNQIAVTVNSATSMNGLSASTATLGTVESAALAQVTAIDAALDNINGMRADYGAAQNRFEATIANLQVASENTAAARGRIMDADFAGEASNLSRAQILQQAGTAMVAQANQLPQGVLALLR